MTWEAIIGGVIGATWVFAVFYAGVYVGRKRG